MSHEFSYRINLDDLDYMGVVGHGNWLLILQCARVEMLKSIGHSFEELLRQKITAFVRSVSIEFLRPTIHRDTVSVRVQPIELTSTSVTLSYFAKNQKDEQLIEAKLKIVFAEPSGRPTRIPESIRAELAKLLPHASDEVT